MDAERWQKIERVFHAVLQADPSRRATMLEDSCAGDESLRREIESLLAHHENAGNVIETPAFATAKPTSGSEPPSPTSVGAAPIALGATIAQYRVLEEIGAGGMGVVYKAEDTKLGRPVALKFLPKSLATDSSALKRFQREARAASALNHPNICTIYDIEEYQGHPFIAMEYLEGRTLKDHILGRSLENDEISKLSIQIAEGLSAAHSKGVVHRDVKPGNIVVTASGPVKVLDFGLAKLIGPQGGNAPTTTLTKTHAMTGTLPYMSPEQLRGREVDARTDIYALGIVLYEMATGRRPFTTEISPQLIYDILNSPPPLPRQVNGKISPKLEEIILKCLEKDPEDRYQTAKEIAVDLRRMTGASSASQPLVAAQARRFGKAARFHWAAIPVLGLAILVVGWVFFRTTLFKPIHSIAVLPFADDSKDASSEYVADGITEGVIDKLSVLSNMKIISRTSAFRYKKREIEPRRVARELGVQALVTGTIAQRGDDLWVSTELVDAREDRHLWGEQYRRRLADIPAVQQEIATAISESLRIRLTSGEKKQLTKLYRTNPEAYELYLKGRYYWSKGTLEGLEKGVGYFERAIEKDPGNPQAYAGLADCYNDLGGGMSYLSPKENFPKAKAAATKALELDDSLAEAHTALGWVKWGYDWDWPSAEREFKRAIELNPSSAVAHGRYASYLVTMGRFDEGVAEGRRAQEFDPLSQRILGFLGYEYLAAGRYDESISQLNKAIELDPTATWLHAQLGWAYARKGMYAQAIAEHERLGVQAYAVTGENQVVSSGLAWIYGLAGKRNEATRILEAFKHLSPETYVDFYQIGVIYVGLGNKDRAFESLERGYTERSGSIVYIKADPFWDTAFRADSRYANLLRRMGLPQ